MKRQNDWFTGIDYYDNHKEKEISVERTIIDTETQIKRHEQVEMFYVVSGEAIVSINGRDYDAKEGSFFCMYPHHFHHIRSVQKALEVISVKFYIGLFMYMSWEKHPKYVNAKLMYDTRPMVSLQRKQKEKIKELVQEILQERENQRFGSMNMVQYKTLELHTYFCRYAYEHIGIDKKEESEVWKVIKVTILTTGKNLSLEEAAKATSLSPKALNRSIKETCGYTFFQLQQFGKIINACALLHFPQLSMEYISDLLGFSSVNAFYRSFVKYCLVTPREYQEKYIRSKDWVVMGSGYAMQFLQYMHIHFMKDLSLEGICKEFCIKEYTGKQIFEEVFGSNFNSVLNEIRVCYASAFLRTYKLNILEISLMCGFDSLSTFQRNFKFYMHQTPTEYRSAMKHEENRLEPK
ncbi:AraC family transcriptional regulator [Sporanaerobium hydrogeniformans]|uniref:AraC family transcriptional regulator n=1 Tax=Sporanaerobium hydrogeniformans TaxID=3072179 RepID=A0AC61DH81_9FIRM|nr:helix-turn-helix domain-containing protein [Sporanaerobium hydrogeniformans]PHV72220.1 AraC family transcriptional regulator [Sporanaerobium hydrogeniformans]